MNEPLGELTPIPQSKRVDISAQMRSLLIAARRIAVENDAEALVILAELPYDFGAIKRYLRKVRLIVASDKPDVQRAAREDETDLVPLLHEPQTRQLQLSQALLEAIADDLLHSGDKIVALYAVFERVIVDTISLVNLADHLAKLTARDLRRLETEVPLETLRIVVDLAVEIGARSSSSDIIARFSLSRTNKCMIPSEATRRKNECSAIRASARASRKSHSWTGRSSFRQTASYRPPDEISMPLPRESLSRRGSVPATGLRPLFPRQLELSRSRSRNRRAPSESFRTAWSYCVSSRWTAR
jgi:hypothetical protein